MSDPGRITSNPHKVAQWKARWRCEQDRHIWDGSRCARCGFRTRVTTVHRLANVGWLTESAARAALQMVDLADAAERAGRAVIDLAAAYRARGA